MTRVLPLLALLLALPLGGCLKHQLTPLAAAPDGRIIRVGDAELHVVQSGPPDGPPVLMVHGFASNLRIWEAMAAALPGHRVVRVDLLGFGRSSRYEGDYRRVTQAALLVAVLDELGIQRADVVAHSMGAAVSLTLAAEFPDRVGRLALIGPWVFEEQVPWAFRDARQPGLGEISFGLWYEEHLDLRMRYGFFDPDLFVTEEVVDGARDGLERPGARAAALAVVRGLDLPGLEAALPSIETPILIVQGREDPVAALPYAEQLASIVGDVELVVLPRCGHFPMLEAQGRTEGLVRRFLR